MRFYVEELESLRTDDPGLRKRKRQAEKGKGQVKHDAVQQMASDSNDVALR